MCNENILHADLLHLSKCMHIMQQCVNLLLVHTQWSWLATLHFSAAAINTFQCYTWLIDIKFGILTLLTCKFTILSIIISFVLENHQYLNWDILPCYTLDYLSRNPLTNYVYKTLIVLLMTIGAVMASSRTENFGWSSRSSGKESMLFLN